MVELRPAASCWSAVLICFTLSNLMSESWEMKRSFNLGSPVFDIGTSLEESRRHCSDTHLNYQLNTGRKGSPSLGPGIKLNIYKIWLRLNQHK